MCIRDRFWDGMDIGTGAAVKEAGMHEKVFLATSGGGGKNGCDNLKNDIFDVNSDILIKLHKELVK